MMGLPPTGKTVELPGADFLVVEDAGIRSVTGYFDSAALPRQLGLQTIVQPNQIGPFAFGISTAVQSGKQTNPGAISMTSLVLADPTENELVANGSPALCVKRVNATSGQDSQARACARDRTWHGQTSSA